MLTKCLSWMQPQVQLAYLSEIRLGYDAYPGEVDQRLDSARKQVIVEAVERA